jgi:tRNA pseudouridine55 synthase
VAAVTGIFLLDKPLGLSSNHALQRVKRLLGAQKAGHVGSLDPLATGMLPICLGEATKIAGEILSLRKQYRYTVKLGERTATGDAEGDVVETLPVPPVDADEVRRAVAGFMGRQQQVPPMYSAIKKEGQPLYRIAREGGEVERAPREIEVFEYRLVGIEGPSLQLDVLCAKGTYVRVLAEDLARALGTCGHVTQLRRLYVEPFAEEPMSTLEDLEGAAPPRILPADRGVPHFPAVTLDAPSADKLRHGQAVRLAAARPPGRVRLYDQGGGFMGVGEAEGAMDRPRRLWVGGVRE